MRVIPQLQKNFLKSTPGTAYIRLVQRGGSRGMYEA